MKSLPSQFTFVWNCKSVQIQQRGISKPGPRPYVYRSRTHLLFSSHPELGLPHPLVAGGVGQGRREVEVTSDEEGLPRGNAGGTSVTVRGLYFSRTNYGEDKSDTGDGREENDGRGGGARRRTWSGGGFDGD